MKTIIKSLILSITLCFTITSYATPQTPDYQTTILANVNSYRTTQGLKPLVLDAYMSDIATSHSQDMAQNRTPFGHTGFESRMQKALQHFQQARGFAENVAFTPQIASVVDMWLHSSGHRQNIEGNFNLTGIGIAYDQKGSAYVTQVFLAVADPKN